MRKKGQIFVIMVLIFFTLAMFTLIIGANFKFRVELVKGVPPRIGMYASAIMDVYQEQENSLLYTDNAAGISLSNALVELGNKGGLDDPECGNSGYNLWNKNKETICLPKQEEALKNFFRQDFSELARYYTKTIIPTDHILTLNQRNDNLEIVGITATKSIIPVMVTGTAKITERRTCETPIQDTPSITTEEIRDILTNVNSPAADSAKVFFEKGEETGIDPVFALAFFNQESGMGTNKLAQTSKAAQNMGNIRVPDTCNKQTRKNCLQRARSSNERQRCDIECSDNKCDYIVCSPTINCFCGYDEWGKGIEQWYDLLKGPLYIGGGKDTVEKIIPRYAPESDGNDEQAYIDNVRNFAKQHKNIPCFTGTSNPSSPTSLTGVGNIPADTIMRINQYDDTITASSIQEEVEQAFIKAIITQESGGVATAISTTGCAGIAQFCYVTATDFFPADTLTSISTDRDHCRPSDGRYVCDEYVMNRDPRFKPEQAIPAQAEYLSDLTSQFNDYTHKTAFAAAAYNGGPGVVKEAIKRTGKDDPSWQEVKAQLTVDLLKDVASLYESWTDAEVEAKIVQITDYVNKVSGFYLAWGGLDIFTPTLAGTFEFGQNFRTDTEYDLSVYEVLKEFAEDTIGECNDNVAKCLEDKRIEFNENNDFNIAYLSDCEEGSDKVYYDFVENLQDCSDSWGDNCKCRITPEYSEEEMEMFEDSYRITMKKSDNFEIIPVSEERTPDIIFDIEMSNPKELSSEYSTEYSAFWAPIRYLFNYRDGLENEEMAFYFDATGDHVFLNDFDNLFMVRRDDRFALWGQYGEELRPPGGEGEQIFANCPIAKKTFRLCTRTNFALPTLEEENRRKSLSYENSKIKFALNLIDEVAPDSVQSLTAERVEPGEAIGFVEIIIPITGFATNKDVLVSWEAKKPDDMVLFRIYTKGGLGPVWDKKEIDLWIDKAEASILTSKQRNKLYFKGVGDGVRRFEVLLDKDYFNFRDELNYEITVTAIDNFQNEGEKAIAVLIPEIIQ